MKDFMPSHDACLLFMLIFFHEFIQSFRAIITSLKTPKISESISKKNRLCFDHP